MAICDNGETNPQFSFKELKIRGGEKGKHKDGWGIGFYESKKAVIYKKPEPAFESELAKRIEDGEIKLKSQIFLAHIRLASSGNQLLENTHPFKRKLFDKEWIFAHNGTVGHYQSQNRIFKEDIGDFETEGQTDSERAFCYILNQLKNRCTKKSRIEEIAKVIEESAEFISKMGVFNFIMSDSEYLFCFGDNSLYYVRREFGHDTITLNDSDYSIKVSDMKRTGERAIIVATLPLTQEVDWKQINGLMVFKDGRKIL